MFPSITENRLFLLLFVCAILLHCLPVFLFPITHTIDGASHVYNANVLNNLLFAENSPFFNFFSLNKEPVPNWGGHLLLMILLKLGITATAAHQIILLVYIIAFPVTVFLILRLISKSAIWGVFVFFPLIHNFTLYSGFYNFCLGFPLLFLGWFYTIKLHKNPSVINAIGLLIITSSIFFFHLFHSILLLLFVVAFIAVAFGQTSQLPSWRFFIIISVCLLPVFILTGVYYLNRPPVLEKVFLSKKELLNWLFTYRASIIYHSEEKRWLAPFAWLLLVAAGYFIIKQFRSIKHYPFAILFAAFCAIALGLLFFTPDNDGYGSIISVRFCLLFFITLSFFISIIITNKYTLISIGAVAVLCSAFQITNIIKEQRVLSQEAEQLINLSAKIDDDKLLVVINEDDHWLKGHFGNYLAFKSNAVVIHNYEADKGYFPVLWKNPFPRITALGKDYTFFNTYWKSDIDAPKNHAVDYIVVIRNEQNNCNSCGLLQGASIIENTPKAILYRLQ